MKTAFYFKLGEKYINKKSGLIFVCTRIENNPDRVLLQKINSKVSTCLPMCMCGNIEKYEVENE